MEAELTDEIMTLASLLYVYARREDGENTAVLIAQQMVDKLNEFLSLILHGRRERSEPWTPPKP